MSETTSTLRLRQVALVATELDPVLRSLGTELGLEVAHRDPAATCRFGQQPGPPITGRVPDRADVSGVGPCRGRGHRERAGEQHRRVSDLCRGFAHRHPECAVHP